MHRDTQRCQILPLFGTDFSFSLATILGSCNTVHGLGEDIERGGEKLKMLRIR